MAMQLGMGSLLLWSAVRWVAGFTLRLVLGLLGLMLVLGALEAVQEWTTSTTDVPPVEVAEPTPRAIPIPWTGAQPRWRSETRCLDAIDPGATLLALTARVDTLNALRPGDSSRRGVLAIVRGENAAGVCLDFVATQTNVNVEREVRDALGPRERAVWQETGLPEGWRDMHAEQKAISSAWMAGFRPIALAASSAFCSASRDPGRHACDSWLTSTGAVRVGDRGAVWSW